MSQNQDKNKLRMLAETQHAFTGWRLKHKKGSTIPEDLWEKALALLSHFAVTKVATGLRLNGQDLKRRATAAGLIAEEPGPVKTKPAKAKAKKKPQKKGLVEMVLPRGQEDNQSEAMKKTGKAWRITLTRDDGTRLEIIPPEFNDARMHGLVRGFLGG